jgi:hypothetical protein
MPWTSVFAGLKGLGVVGGLGQRPWDPQPGELCHPPLVYEQVVVVDRLMAWSCRRRFHRFLLAAMQAGFLAITLGSPSPRPNPQKLLVLARDLLVVAAGLTAAR